MKRLLFPLAALLLGSGVSAAPEDKTDLAIRRAVSFLVTQQDKDGAIQSKYVWANRTATTALALMAMASVMLIASFPSPFVGPAGARDPAGTPRC